MTAPSPIAFATASRPRFQLRSGALDPAAIARAEAALKSLSSQFDGWMQDELGKLDAARAAVAPEGLDTRTADALYTRAHDLKGLGGTYQYPIVTRLAASLCRLLDGPLGRAGTPLALLDAHVAAIHRCVREDVRDDEHPTGRSLAETLEAEVTAYRRGGSSGSITAP